MYSKYDDPNYRPAPGEWERDRLREIAAEISALNSRLSSLRDEITDLTHALFPIDNPPTT